MNFYEIKLKQKLIVVDYFLVTSWSFLNEKITCIILGLLHNVQIVKIKDLAPRLP